MQQSNSDSLIFVYENKILDKEEKFNLLIDISFAATNIRKQRKYAFKSLNLALQDNNKKWEGKSYYIIGQSYKAEGKLDSALFYLIKSLSLYEATKNTHGEAAVKNELGSVYQRQRNHKEALKNYKSSYELYDSIGNLIGTGSALANLGEEYRIWSQFDSSLYYSKKSKQIFEHINYNYGLAYSLGNIGLSLAELDQTDSAIYYIDKATTLHDELNDRYPIAVYQTYMADIYKDKGDEEKALEYAHNSLNIAEEEGLKEQIRDASLKLSELYSEFGDFEKAYDYQDQYITYRDSINNADVIRKMTDLRTEYEVSKKQTEINLLDARNKNQTIINYTLAGGVVMLLILGHLFYQNSRKSRQVNDILSEQKEEIESQRDKLEELVDMKNRFFGIISHDLRSPVNSLQGISQLLQFSIKNKQEKEVGEFVGLADQSINNLSSLLDNLLSWALSQQGSLPYNPEKFKFYYVAKEVKNIFQNAALAKQIEINVTVSEDVEIYADRDGIFALTRNLVNNALKFTGNGGTISINAEQSGSVSQIHIADSGIGIPEEKLQNLFIFDKKKSTKGTAGEKGSGLGLALCQDIVQLNGGEISVKSKYKEGSTFTVILPADKSSVKS